MIAAILFLSVFVAIFLGKIFYKKNRNPTLLLAFSGSYLISVSVLHLLPEIYHGHNHNIGLVIMLGFLFQVTLDFFSKGIEHGHGHTEDFKKGIIPFSALAGLFLHAFFEGLPLGGDWSNDDNHSFLIAIVFHKIPISIVLYFLLKELKIKSSMFWSLLILFALMAPFGGWMGTVLPMNEEFQNYTMAFVIGIFFHVSTTILYETSKDHKFNIIKLSVVVLGLALAYLSTFH